METKSKNKDGGGFEPGFGVQKMSIKDLVFDDRNANKGTSEGAEVIKTSIGRYGVGRGVLVDKNKKLIAGNHAVKEMISQGIEEVIIVPTTGKQLVVTQRVDIEKDSAIGHGLALADNRATQANLDFDFDLINDLDAEFEIGLDDFKFDFSDTTDAAEQMEEYGGAYEEEEGVPPYQDKKDTVKNNMAPLMVSLTKAERIAFDRIKERYDCVTDYETIIKMIKLLEE